MIDVGVFGPWDGERVADEEVLDEAGVLAIDDAVAVGVTLGRLGGRRDKKDDGRQDGGRD